MIALRPVSCATGQNTGVTSIATCSTIVTSWWMSLNLMHRIDMSRHIHVRLATSSTKPGSAAKVCALTDTPHSTAAITQRTAPTDTPGTANCDFVVFPPRWMVAEDTFRPPWFHRNVMSEFMGLVHGAYDAKADGFLPGGASLHNSFSAHGPDRATFERASNAELAPQKIADTLAFMFETRLVIRPTEFALNSEALQCDYDECWLGFEARYRLS